MKLNSAIVFAALILVVGLLGQNVRSSPNQGAPRPSPTPFQPCRGNFPCSNQGL